MKKIISIALTLAMLLSIVAVNSVSVIAGDTAPVSKIVFDDKMPVEPWDKPFNCDVSYDSAEGAFKFHPVEGTNTIYIGCGHTTASTSTALSSLIGDKIKIGKDGYHWVKITMKSTTSFDPKDTNDLGMRAFYGTSTDLANGNWATCGMNHVIVPKANLSALNDGKWHEFVCDLRSAANSKDYLAHNTIELDKILVTMDKITTDVWVKSIEFFDTKEEANGQPAPVLDPMRVINFDLAQSDNLATWNLGMPNDSTVTYDTAEDAFKVTTKTADAKAAIGTGHMTPANDKGITDLGYNTIKIGADGYHFMKVRIKGTTSFACSHSLGLRLFAGSTANKTAGKWDLMNATAVPQATLNADLVDGEWHEYVVDLRGMGNTAIKDTVANYYEVNTVDLDKIMLIAQGVTGEVWFDYVGFFTTKEAAEEYTIPSNAMLSAVDTDDGSGCVKIPGGSGYHAMYFWTQFKDLNPHTISFYTKGTKGETLMYGYEGSYGVAGSYTFKATNQWEKVTLTATSTALPAAGDHTINGFPFRVYVDSNTTNPIYVDYVQFDQSAITKFTGTDLNTTGAPFGAWSPSNSSEYCSTENYVDGKIEHLYLNAVVADDDAVNGFIIAENEYATDACMKLQKDGGNPLFVKECKKYDVILEGAAYEGNEITALNLGGEEGDKVISLYWKNMPVYGTFAYRTYKVLSNGAVIYGEIQTVSLEDGISLKPLAMPG